MLRIADIDQAIRVRVAADEGAHVADDRELTVEEDEGVAGIGADCHSLVMKKVMSFLDKIAPTSLPVLVTGETGTGKELVARAIHAGSERRKRPFVSLNCAAVPGHLIEAELFGYRPGAFSGAQRDHPGLLVQAQGGSLLFDEISELSPELQGKILRVLENGCFRRDLFFRLSGAIRRHRAAGTIGAPLAGQRPRAQERGDPSGPDLHRPHRRGDGGAAPGPAADPFALPPGSPQEIQPGRAAPGARARIPSPAPLGPSRGPEGAGPGASG